MLGPDTVDLIFRDPVTDPDSGDPQYDPDTGRPLLVDRVVTKSNAKFTIIGVTETNGVPPVAIYNAKAALPVDADTTALRKTDAIRFDGQVYELNNDARVKTRLIGGQPHHVRVHCSREEPARSVDECIVVTPRGGQDLDGRRLPDGAPFELVALAVDVGNTAERYGVEGVVDEVDFTIVLPLGSGVRDGDWITVRGRKGLARVAREYSQHADRNQEVVFVRSRTGGG